MFYDQLVAAGLPVTSADENGMVTFSAPLTPAQESQFSDLILSYFHSADYAILVRVRNRLNAAKTTAKSIPNWATWAQQDWATWRDANVSATQINAVASLADAKVILNKMATVLDSLAKMEIALRDQTWPDLPEG